MQGYVPGDLRAEPDRGRLLRAAVAAGHARLPRKEPSLPTRCLGACDLVAFALRDPEFRKLAAVFSPSFRMALALDSRSVLPFPG